VCCSGPSPRASPPRRPSPGTSGACSWSGDGGRSHVSPVQARNLAHFSVTSLGVTLLIPLLFLQSFASNMNYEYES
jgi:hypothetical protein